MVKAFKFNVSNDVIIAKVEKKRDKGGGLFKKRPEEKVTCSYRLLLPYVYFEFEYLGSIEVNRYIGLYKKGPRQSRTLYNVFWGRANLDNRGMLEDNMGRLDSYPLLSKDFAKLLFPPLLCLEIEYHQLVEINDGSYVPLSQTSAEELAQKVFATIKNNIGYPWIAESISLVDSLGKQDLLTVTEVQVVYMPYWIARLETPDATRYVVYDREGKEEVRMSELLTSNIAFAQSLEQSVQEIGKNSYAYFPLRKNASDKKTFKAKDVEYVSIKEYDSQQNAPEEKTVSRKQLSPETLEQIRQQLREESLKRVSNQTVAKDENKEGAWNLTSSWIQPSANQTPNQIRIDEPASIEKQPASIEKQPFVAAKETDDYISKCLKPEFKEEAEPREWNSDADLLRIVNSLNSSKYSEVCSLAESYVSKFADFDLLYCWWGTALLELSKFEYSASKLGYFEKARQVLRKGLEMSHRKYMLCEDLGKVEWKAGNIMEAVYWWAQGMHCQETLTNYGSEVGTYLYLYYVALGAGITGYSPEIFLTMRVDHIKAGQIRLNYETATDLTNLARTERNSQVPQVLSQLVTKYLVPKQTSKPKASNEEVSRLIWQLQSEDYKVQEQAAKMLGELGDTRAIEPLMKAMRNSLFLGLHIEADEAIKKIKEANR